MVKYFSCDICVWKKFSFSFLHSKATQREDSLRLGLRLTPEWVKCIIITSLSLSLSRLARVVVELAKRKTFSEKWRKKVKRMFHSLWSESGLTFFLFLPVRKFATWQCLPGGTCLDFFVTRAEQGKAWGEERKGRLVVGEGEGGGWGVRPESRRDVSRDRSFRVKQREN